MPTEIDRDHVQRLIAQGAQLVEVLPAEEYAEAHLPGALNLPLKILNQKTVGQLERERPVIVYCYDFQCDLSPRSAARLESLGFKYVFDYAAGKRDWFAAGLPMEGDLTPVPKASESVRRDIPTCYPTEGVDEVWERVRARGWKMCVVVNQARVVLGRLRGGAGEAGPRATRRSASGGGAFGSAGGPCRNVLPEGGGFGGGVGSGSADATDGSVSATTVAPASVAIVSVFARRLRSSGIGSGSCMQTKLQCCCREASVGWS